MKFNINKKTRKDKSGKVIKTELWYSYTYKGVRQRGPLGLEDTKANRKFVENEIFPDMLVKIKNDEIFKNTEHKQQDTIIVDEYVMDSLEQHRGNRNEESQKDVVSIYKNHIADILGKMKVKDIKASHLRKWQNSMLDKGLSPARVKRMRSVLFTMFNDAIDDDIIQKNPLLTVKSPKIPQTDINPFTLDEINLILSVAQGQNRNFYSVAFFTGMRSAELLGLKWSDIDFENKEITINETIKMGQISTTKNEQSKRTIDMLDVLVPYLKEQYKLTGKYNSYVFLNDKNEHLYDIKRIRDTHWKKDLKKAGLDYTRIYETRHSFATLMLSNSEPILWVSNMLGHKDATMTLSRYARYIKRDKVKRAEFLNESVCQTVTKLVPSDLNAS